MPLFDVPGWSVPTAIASQPSPSKKRKRPSAESDRVHSAELNLDKLVKRLKGSNNVANASDSEGATEGATGGSKGFSKKKQKADGRRLSIAHDDQGNPKTISRPKPLRPRSKVAGVANKAVEVPLTKRQSRRIEESAKEKSPTNVVPTASSPSSMFRNGLTALQQGMKQSLDGARFRIINEKFYKTDSRSAHEMVREDPKIFEEYHAGFRHQVEAWPTNPVAGYISKLSTYAPGTIIADLGCGDAALARALLPKGLIVLSYDLVSDGIYVVEADICAKIPLPGSEGDSNKKSEGEGAIVDVVVCALSLMGTNWPGCIREAWRILKPNGELKVAEVASRFSDVEQFQSLVSSVGFRLKSKDSSNSHFTLFEFRKTARPGKSHKDWTDLLSKSVILKPCEYKRR